MGDDGDTLTCGYSTVLIVVGISHLCLTWQLKLILVLPFVAIQRFSSILQVSGYVLHNFCSNLQTAKLPIYLLILVCLDQWTSNSAIPDVLVLRRLCVPRLSFFSLQQLQGIITSAFVVVKVVLCLLFSESSNNICSCFFFLMHIKCQA